jgi:hypothetical protein
MTPPDGGDFGFPQADDALVLLPAPQAILLHGGRALLLFEGADAPPPRRGELIQPGGALGWTAECWRADDAGRGGWSGLAVLDGLPAADAELRAPGEPRRWRFAAALRVDVAPQPLADLVRRGGVDQRVVFDFLLRELISGKPADSAEAQAHLAFARGFFAAAAERDGFIEIVARPDCGGLFAQGWSLSLPAGPATLASVSGELALHEVEVATFAREDILPPGRGFCLYGKDWRATRMGEVEAVFYEKDGRLFRLDVVTSGLATFEDAEATGHVAHMLPRLAAPDATLRRFKRICRPRFGGEDTLSATQAPIAVGVDAALQAPDGGLFLMGWLLDPLRRVRLALAKSDRNLYHQLHNAWVRLPRPDLVAGFGGDPRFAGLLDPEDALFGFVVHVPASRSRVEGAQVYLELVLDDESCLFRPLAPTPFAGGDRLPQILSALSPTEPELGRIVEEHLTPFLASVPPKAASTTQTAARPIPLGPQGDAREVSAVMPIRSLAEVQPALALLAGTPDAEGLELILVATRAVAAELLKPLSEAFTFYGLTGALVIAGERDTLAGRLDAGAAAGRGRRVLAWTSAVLPKGPGWLADLLAEADALPEPGLISPTMTYEDGSVYFGGGASHAAASGPVCAVAGYGATWLQLGAPVALEAGAAEIALVDRDLLERAGGFAGRLFSDAYARVDLADRLRRAGARTWRSGLVEFWMLEDAHAAEPGPFHRILQQVDAGLLARRAAASPEV